MKPSVARAPSTEDLATGRGRLGPASERAVAHALQEGGQRITQIDEWTRTQLQKRVSEAIEQGMSPAEAGAYVRDWSGFDEYRAERIARTEMMFSFNNAAARTYADYGVKQVVADDGDQDPECAARHGRVFTVDEALGIEDHPNGTLDWLPVAPDVSAQAIQGQLHEIRPIANMPPEPGSYVDQLLGPITPPSIPDPVIDLSSLPVSHGNIIGKPYLDKSGKVIVDTQNSGKVIQVQDGWVQHNAVPDGIPSHKPTAGDTWAISKDQASGQYLAKDWVTQEAKFTWNAAKNDWEPIGAHAPAPQLPAFQAAPTGQDFYDAAAILDDLEHGKVITIQQSDDLVKFLKQGVLKDADVIQATKNGEKVALKKSAQQALDDLADGQALGSKQAMVQDAINQGLITNQEFQDAVTKGLAKTTGKQLPAKPTGMSPQAEGDWQWMKDHGWTQGLEADGTVTMHAAPGLQVSSKVYYLNPNGLWETTKAVKPTFGGSAPPSVTGQALSDVQQLQGWTWSQDATTGKWAYIHPDKTWGMELADDGTHWTKSISASSHAPAAPPVAGGGNAKLLDAHIPGKAPDIQVSGHAGGTRVASGNYGVPKGRLIDHLPAEKPEPLADYSSIMTKRPAGGKAMSQAEARKGVLGDGDTLLNRDLRDDVVLSHQSDWAGSSQSDYAWAAKEAAARDGMVTLNPYEQGAINDVRVRMGAGKFDEAVQTAQRMQQYQRTRIGRVVDPNALMTVYRGVRLQPTGWNVGDLVDFDGGALSSWSLSLSTAQSFAHPSGSKYGYVLESRVRARDISGTPGVSGMGTFYEQKVVLYGGNRQAKVLEVRR